MKIIGLMLTWNNLEFFKHSVHQALSFCDELIVVEGCHSQQYPKRSADGTCGYIESIRGLPKLRVMDFNLQDRYDIVQLAIRSEFPKTSEFYKKGNWVFHWDDDCFFIEEKLPRLRMAMETTECDSLSYVARIFIYNFRFNLIAKGSFDTYRIVDDMYLLCINKTHYKNGKEFTFQHVSGITMFHYSYVKKPERFKARMAMSVEKGVKASKRKYEKWMSVRWGEDEDIFKSKAIINDIRPYGEELDIYKGRHPKAVDNHPWRHIEDIRKVKI